MGLCFRVAFRALVKPIIIRVLQVISRRSSSKRKNHPCRRQSIRKQRMERMCLCYQRRTPRSPINHRRRSPRIATLIVRIGRSQPPRTGNRPRTCPPNKIRFTPPRASTCWRCSETPQYTPKTKTIIRRNLRLLPPMT